MQEVLGSTCTVLRADKGLCMSSLLSRCCSTSLSPSVDLALALRSLTCGTWEGGCKLLPVRVACAVVVRCLAVRPVQLGAQPCQLLGQLVPRRHRGKRVGRGLQRHEPRRHRRRLQPLDEEGRLRAFTPFRGPKNQLTRIRGTPSVPRPAHVPQHRRCRWRPRRASRARGTALRALGGRRFRSGCRTGSAWSARWSRPRTGRGSRLSPDAHTREKHDERV